MVESEDEFFETVKELLVSERDLRRGDAYLPAVCGKDLTVSCVPASCGRSPGHPGECSVLSEAEVSSIDGEARAILDKLFPAGLFAPGSFER